MEPTIAEYEKTTQQKIDTLVFVSDGLFRSIPMAALYDGEHYLIERYAIALAPGLQTLAPSPSKAARNALIGGLSLPQSGFSSLPNVETELRDIQAILPTQKLLLDQTFTQRNLENAITSQPISVVHLATHGRFSSQAENTFLLVYKDGTGNDKNNDDRLNINELGDLLKDQPENRSEGIDLLVLSACETATGDARATLGLAGIAARSGARSTLATLWKAQDDKAAWLLAEFYRQLYQNGSNLNKAEALRQAQIAVLKQTSYPREWALFVLVGSWL